MLSKKLSNGEAHVFVEFVLKAYFKKWWRDLPHKRVNLEYGRMSVELSCESDIADGVAVEWDCAYGVIDHVDVPCQLPLDD